MRNTPAAFRGDYFSAHVTDFLCDRVSIALYLFLGWSGIFVFKQMTASFSQLTIFLILLGGLLYSVGIVFHVWSRLRYQNAIWHGFVLVAAGCHYGAVASSLG